MESFLSRYRNLIVLLVVLLAQVVGLAVQLRKPRVTASALPGIGATNAQAASALPSISRDRPDGPGVRLIRLWAADLVTPFERVFHNSGQKMNDLWINYVDLRNTRQQNKDLQQTVDRLRLEQATILEDARQGQRLQELMHFQQTYIYKTLPAQVIGTSGSSQSNVIFIDKGAEDGLAVDMAVITGDGIVGKVRDVFPHSAQVLMINDQTSGAGVVLEATRTRGILRGNANGQPQVINILADQRIKAGDPVLTAGGDQIFPRGLPVGVVQQVVQDPERGSFIDVIVKPAANLGHLDEVLVITSLDAHLSPQQLKDLKTSQDLKGAEVQAEADRKKAAAQMSERLPGLKETVPTGPTTGQVGASASPVPLGPDGKPVPVPGAVPATAKPLPAKHADRFTPGAKGEPVETPAARGTEADPNADRDALPVKPKPAVTKPKTQPVPKPQTVPPAEPQ